MLHFIYLILRACVCNFYHNWYVYLNFRCHVSPIRANSNIVSCYCLRRNFHILFEYLFENVILKRYLTKINFDSNLLLNCVPILFSLQLHVCLKYCQNSTACHARVLRIFLIVEHVESAKQVKSQSYVVIQFLYFHSRV